MGTQEAGKPASGPQHTTKKSGPPDSEKVNESKGMVGSPHSPGKPPEALPHERKPRVENGAMYCCVHYANESDASEIKDRD